MDENLVEQISTATGVPQELVSRSAQARAQASGVAAGASPVDQLAKIAFTSTPLA